MRQGIFLFGLQGYLENRRTAGRAAARLRNMLANDRTLLRSDVTKRLNAELSEVLSRYFAVSDLCFSVEPQQTQPTFRYTLEAELLLPEV